MKLPRGELSVRSRLEEGQNCRGQSGRRTLGGSGLWKADTPDRRAKQRGVAPYALGRVPGRGGAAVPPRKAEGRRGISG